MAEQMLDFTKVGPRVPPEPWPTQVRWVYDDVSLDVTHIEYEGTDVVYGKPRVNGETAVKWKEADGAERVWPLDATPLGTPLRVRIPPGQRWSWVAFDDPELGPGLRYPEDFEAEYEID